MNPLPIPPRGTRWLLTLTLTACAAEEPKDSVGPVEPLLAADPPALDFGASPLGERVEGVVEIHNQGQGELSFANVTLSGGDTSPFSILTPAEEWFIILPAGLTLEIELGFTPSQRGFSGSRLRLRSDDPHRPELFVTLAGQGLEGVLEPLQDELDVGEAPVGSVCSGEVWFTNAGDSPISPTSAEVEGEGWALDGDLGELGPGEVGFLSLRFSPSRHGRFDGRLLVDAGERTEIPLQGRGIEP